jgi:hypothetical protein
MPSLVDLPNELVDQVFISVADPRCLHPFLFCRKLYGGAKRAIYLDLRLIVWNLASRPLDFGQSETELVSVSAVHEKLISVTLLVDAAEENPHLLAHTRRVVIKLSEESACHWPKPYLPSASIHNNGLGPSTVVDMIEDAAWDKHLSAILKQAPKAEEVTCDFIREMSILRMEVLPQLTNLRVLSLQSSP